MSTSIIKGGVEKFALKQPIFLVRPTTGKQLVSGAERRSYITSRPQWILCTPRSSFSRVSVSTIVSLQGVPLLE